VSGGLLQGFLSLNWFLVYSIYGLAFFLMGFSIAFHVRRPSTFRLGRYLWLLAVFGLLHGIAEWAYIFFPPSLESGGWETFRGAVLNSRHAILIASSFVFLFSFGGSLLASTLGWKQWLPWVPVTLMAVWIWIFLFNTPANPDLTPQWLTLAEISSRYFLALPGAILTSVGLYLQRGEIRGLHHPPLERVLLGASAAFALYAFAGGMVVPRDDFFPASFLNASVFLNIGLPVQLLRAVAGVLMAYFVIRSLGLFEIENRERLDSLHQRELIWLERERIRRDLHDGVIQSIYGLSLGLDHALNLLKKEPEACENKIREMGGRADAIINQLRRYLQEMKNSFDLPDNVVLILEDLLADFTASSGLAPNLRCRGIQESEMAHSQRDHFYHMASEILSNISRHSGAKFVEAELDMGTSGIRLTIRDNGVGFMNKKFFSRGMGLVNLRERAALAGGLVNFKSYPGQGTEVSLWLPYHLPAGEGKS